MRPPSKLRGQVSADTRGRRISRTLSASTVQSSKCHTVQHKSMSVSPKKKVQDTPEWKRRLLKGDIAYGDQRDLFAPAGLEAIFKQPAPPTMSTKPSARPTMDEESSMMPSSPPPYPSHASHNVGLDEDEQTNHTQNRQKQAPQMKYRLLDEGGSGFSANDLSQSSNFRPRKSMSQGQHQDGPSEFSESNFQSSINNEAQVPRRLLSGQSDTRNEELSPIYISRHNTTDGKIDYAALDVSATELKQRLEKICEGDDREPSLQRPEDALDDSARDGRFVNIRRGGYSQEGSFRKRMLSPSSLPVVDESMVLPESSIQTSTPKQLPVMRKTRASREYHDETEGQNSPPQPQAPHPSPSKAAMDRKQNTGSPLKLFGDYDTFTNQKLLRRLSQFEGRYEDSEEDCPRNSQIDSGHAEVNDGFIAVSSPEKHHAGQSGPNTSRKMSSFGQGDLDNYRFSEGSSHDSLESNTEDDDTENVSLPVLDPKSQTSFKFQLEPSPDIEERGMQRTTRYSNRTDTTTHTVTVRRTVRPARGTSESSGTNGTLSHKEEMETPRKRNGGSQGKRLLKSPLKDSTPKRRRTLHDAETAQMSMATGLDGNESLRETHQQMQSISGKKRKDARHGDDQQAANPKVLAMRQILRPRTPTPSQRSSQQRDDAPTRDAQLAAIERSIVSQEKKIAMVQAELDSALTNKPSASKKQMQNESRKGSVTTQDYLDEAKKIMACIRGKKGGSGLTSLEESEAELVVDTSRNENAANIDHEESYESTKEPFSRPPSREGAPVSRASNKQQDPQLLDHLRKYEEKSEADDIVASSMKSLALAKDAVKCAKVLDRITDATIAQSSTHYNGPNETIESDPPNVRISQNPDMPRKRKHSTSTAPTVNDEKPEAEFPSQGSNGSSNHSTSHSIPTGSSRGSDSRQVIAPHTVSHLIPEQLAGMVFDRERRTWVKRKVVSGESKGKEPTLSDETQDDPFGDIPDLSVDETQELMRTRAAAAKRKEESRLAETNQDISGQTHLGEHTQIPDAENKSISYQHGHGVRTRTLTKKETCEDIVEEIEREISINEDRIQSESPARRRNVTITFSSPIASIIQTSDFLHDDSSSIQSSPRPQGIISNRHRKRKSNRRHSSGLLRTGLKSASRHMSHGCQRFPARPVSRIDEKEEESDADDERQRRSLSLVVSETPHVTSRHSSSVVLATPRPSHEVGTLELSPLSDFTMHQADESFGLEVSYVASSQLYRLGHGSKRTLSLSIKELVEKLTEIEPYEPDWEHLKSMDLSGKRLSNLHKLDEFCGQLGELDVSNNQISQLNGAPPGIRYLQIQNNCLSDLAAWGHLNNLQYINVSNNELESLSAFKYLVHLRGLRADNNKIKSIVGIQQLDGLISLRLRGNLVESLDFEASKLDRLTDLDLKDNCVHEVRNLQELKTLSAINLENNNIGDFSGATAEPLRSLKYLKMSGNDLKHLDVSGYPDLRLVYVDRNRLGSVAGVVKAKHLDSLSMREQKDGAVLDMSFLHEAFEIRKLFLSGNFLGKFEVDTPFLNLQYLELASCGIEYLPSNFGQMLANVRVLNLNFNALQDISPLFGILRLKKLHLVGNRLERVRQNTSGLARFRGLTLVDLRNNPLTVGFYSPSLEKQVAVCHASTIDRDEPNGSEPFVLGAADSERDKRHSACLDMQTRMLRKVYEILILAGCPRLKMLDGLKTDPSLLVQEDCVYEAMLEAGIIDRRSAEEDQVEEQKLEGAQSEHAVDEVLVDKEAKIASKQASVEDETYVQSREQPSVESAYVSDSVKEPQVASAMVVSKVALTCVYNGDTWPIEDSFA